MRFSMVGATNESVVYFTQVCDTYRPAYRLCVYHGGVVANATGTHGMAFRGQGEPTLQEIGRNASESSWRLNMFQRGPPMNLLYFYVSVKDIWHGTSGFDVFFKHDTFSLG